MLHELQEPTPLHDVHPLRPPKPLSEPGEEWRAVPFPQFSDLYEVSSLGRVRSCGRGSWKLIRPWRDGKGYLCVQLYSDGRAVRHWVANLVLLAFHGPRPDGHQINHIDGNRENNSIDHLEFCTASENMKHACRMGLKRNDGQHNAAAKLGRAEVIAIGMNYLVGDSIAELARQFGVSYDTVRLIVKDKTWKGV